MSDLLALKVKLEEDDKALILLSSLPPSYDHLVTTILYGKETLELEDVRVIFVNNEFMKQMDSTEERRMPRVWLSRRKWEVRRARVLKRIKNHLSKFLA